MDFIETGRAVFNQEIAELQKVSANIGEELNIITELIYNCPGKVIVTGVGKAGIIGRKIAASLSSTGTQSIFMSATEALHGDLGIVNEGDIVIAISNSGSTLEVINILPPLRDLKATIVAMTGNPLSQLGRESDYILNTHVEGEACPLGVAPTTSTTAMLVMGDALTICLMKKRGFKLEDYATFHPGGALGRRLLVRVKNLMSYEVPIVYESESFKNVIYTVSDRRKGMALVMNDENRFTGIITDGDIRRAIQKYDDILSRKASEFMTTGFKKISTEAIINDALLMMTNNKITSLAVFNPEDPNKIIGLITIHDIIDCNR
jgi:arabinose-5-phosphate isomerase